MIDWLARKYPNANIYGFVFMAGVVGVVVLISLSMTEINKWN